MSDRAPDIARALVEGEIAFDPIQDVPGLLRQRWPGVSLDEMARGIFIAIKCSPSPVTIAGGDASTVHPVISDMRRVEPRPTSTGTLLVARFTCRVGGLLLLGVKLVRRFDGELSVSNVVTGGGLDAKARGVLIEDDQLRAAILAAAVEVLNAMPAMSALGAPPAADAPRRHRGRRAAGR